MKILVANLGSTSFKYRLYDMTGEQLLARGGVERIGSERARAYFERDHARGECTGAIADHAAALQVGLEQLGVGTSPSGVAGEIAAVGFKAAHAARMSGVQRVTENVLEAMEAFAEVAPAHNPPYAKAMRILARAFPELPLVAAFETAFHQDVPPAQQAYAVPLEWGERHGVKRWGFHGASHRHIAERMTQLLQRQDARIISCHLGGSSSLCAIRAGKSVANSFGMSPQSGLPQNNRIGDFDVFALPVLLRETGKSLDEILVDLANRSGLAGLSGTSGDLRDLEVAANEGNKRAQLALDVFVAAIRHYLGAYLVLLGGADAIAFTGGIGENAYGIRAAVCSDLEWAGIHLDRRLNAQARGESPLHAASSAVQIWAIPANEELVVARQVKRFIESEYEGGRPCSSPK